MYINFCKNFLVGYEECKTILLKNYEFMPCLSSIIAIFSIVKRFRLICKISEKSKRSTRPPGRLDRLIFQKFRHRCVDRCMCKESNGGCVKEKEANMGNGNRVRAFRLRCPLADVDEALSPVVQDERILMKMKMKISHVLRTVDIS